MAKRLPTILAVAVIVIVVVLAVVGWDYYLLDRTARLAHPRHDFLKPSGVWGHGVGIIATLVMMCNFLYPARKRIRRLQRMGKLSTWLTFHVFVGVTTPLVIAFHAAFQSNNLFATFTAAGLVIVVLTGLIGRYFFSFLPSPKGRDEWQSLLANANAQVAVVEDAAALDALMGRYRELPGGTLPMLRVVSQMVWFTPAVRAELADARKAFWDAALFEDFAHTYRRLSKAWFRVAFHSQVRRFMSMWRTFHVILAVVLVLLLSVHVALSLYLGFGWILFGTAAVQP